MNQICIPQYRNRSTILHLPTEIVTNICRNVLSLYEYTYVGSIQHQRTLVMLICKRLRAIVSSEPTLWSFIPVAGPFPNFAMIDRLLRHARNTPLHFYLDLRSDDPESHWCTPAMMETLVGGYIVPRMSQVQKLTFIVDRIKVVDSIYTYIASTPGPILREFKLVAGYIVDMEPLSIKDTFGPSRHSAPFFGGHYPSLSSLAVHYASIDHASFDIRNISELDLTGHKVIHPGLFMSIVASVAQLKALTLRHTGPAFEPQTPNSPVANLVHLEKLALGGMDAAYMRYILSLLRCPNVREFGLSTIAEPDIEGVWSAISERHQQTQSFQHVTTLQLFDIAELAGMSLGRPSAYTAFISSLFRLEVLRIRRVSPAYISIMSAQNVDAALVSLPSLHVLEVCGLVEDVGGSDDSGSRGSAEIEPVAITDLAKLLKDLFHSRNGLWNVSRLHLDGDEWDMAGEGRRKRFLEAMVALGDACPRICWDARTVFFNDYYDSEEI